MSGKPTPSNDAHIIPLYSVYSSPPPRPGPRPGGGAAAGGGLPRQVYMVFAPGGSGRGQAGLVIRAGPVSDRWQPDQCQATSSLPDAQPMSQGHVGLRRTAHVAMSCQICGVMSDAQCHSGCIGALTEIHESSLKLVQCWYGTGSLVFSLCVPSPGEAPAFHGARGNRFLSACRAGLLPAMLGAQLGAKNISFQSHPRPIFMYLPMYPYPMYLWRISCVSHVTVCYVNV